MVTGTPSPPEILCLDEVTKDGVVVKQGIAALLDDGKDADRLANDGFYTAESKIGSAQETEKYYRLFYPDTHGPASRLDTVSFCTEYSGEKRGSGILIFPITELPLEARPYAPGKLVQDPNSTDRYFADQLVLVAHHGTSPTTIREIVKTAGNTQDAPAAKITLFLPPFDIYLVEFDGGGTGESVQNAIKAFSAFNEIVQSASPNFEVQNALWAAPDDTRHRGGEQWYLGGSGSIASFSDAGDGKVTVTSDGHRLGNNDVVVITGTTNYNGRFDISDRTADTFDITATWAGDDGSGRWESYGIHANEAWAMGARGSDTVNIAVIDGGIDFGHSDLASKASAETHGVCNTTPASSHGTWVAGAMAAATNNGVGIAGTAWNTKLVSCNRATGSAGSAEAALAIRDSLSTGAKILNMSFIVNAANDSADDLKQAVCDAICDGRLIVAAAGNQPGTGCMAVRKFPAGYNQDEMCACTGTSINYRDAMLAVGALDKQARAAWGMETPDFLNCSNHGDWIDLYAPGKSIRTTNCPTTNPNCPDAIQPTNYVIIGGTSLAAPLVSGAAAVLWAMHSDWKNVDVEKRLRDTASDVNKNASDYTLHPYFSSRIGELETRLTGGRLNLYKAIADPYDIVFVLDRSGSMSGSTHIDPAVGSRWNALTAAVEDFTEMIQHTAPMGSRFGLRLFSSRVLPSLPPTDPEYDIRFNLNDSDFTDLIDIGSHLTDKVRNELDSQDAHVFGSTAMGEGVKDGIAKLSGTGRPRVLVLFTDGEQNVEPFVNSDGCGVAGGTEIRPDCPSPPGSGPAPGTTRIITVGVGTNPELEYHVTLQNLAQNNRGSYICTTDGAQFSDDPEHPELVSLGTIEDAFTHAIVPALAGNSPQMVTSYTGALDTSYALPVFHLNKSINRLFLQVSLSRKFETPDLAPIIAGLRIKKDGTDVTRYFHPVIASNYTDSFLLKTNFVYQGEDKPDRIAPEGSYTVQIIPPTDLPPDLRFRLVPYADDHLLNMEWQVSPIAPRVNEVFKPTLNLHWRGRAVTNAHIEAWILKPGDDMGDLLANNPHTVDPSTAPDAGTPGNQKYLYLLRNDPQFLARLRPKQHQLVLAHEGGGRYSVDYKPGDVSGIYQILYRIHAEDPEFGKIQRLAVQSVYTRPGNIDLADSAVTSTVQRNTVTVNFRPVTTYGRFIGPAQGNALSVDGTGIKLSKVTDHQDGRYTLVLTGNPNAHVSIKLLDEEFYQGPAAKIEPGFFAQLFNWLEGLGLPVWLIWLLLIAIVLLLIWLAWRLITGSSNPQ